MGLHQLSCCGPAVSGIDDELEVGDVALVACLTYSPPPYPRRGVVSPGCNPSTWKIEAGG